MVLEHETASALAPERSVSVRLVVTLKTTSVVATPLHITVNKYRFCATVI